MRERTGKEVPVETVDGEGTGMNGVWGREWKRERGVEIVVVVVVVVEWAVISVERG